MGDIGFCGRCGAPRRPGMAFCNRCGQAYDSAAYGPASPPPPAAPPPQRPPQAQPTQAAPPRAPAPATKRSPLNQALPTILIVGGLVIMAIALVLMFTGGGSPEPSAPVGLALVVAARRKLAAAVAAGAIALLLPTAFTGSATATGFVCPNTLDGVPMVQETPPTENEAIPDNFFAACDYQFNNPEGDAGDRAIHMEAFWTTVDPGLSGFGTSGGGGCATRNGTPTVVHQTPEEGITTQQYYFNSADRYAYVWVLSDGENLEAIQDAAEDMLFLVAEPQAAVCAAETTAGPTDERPPPTEAGGPQDPDNPELDDITTFEWVMLIFGAGAVFMGGTLRARRNREDAATRP